MPKFKSDTEKLEEIREMLGISFALDSGPYPVEPLTKEEMFIIGSSMAGNDEPMKAWLANQPSPPTAPETAVVGSTARPLLSRAQVMERLNCGRSTIFELQKQGKLTAIPLTGKARGNKHYRPEEVEALVAERVKSAPSAK